MPAIIKLLKNMENKKKFVIVGAVLVIIILIIVALQFNKTKTAVEETPVGGENQEVTTPDTAPYEAATSSVTVGEVTKEVTIVVPGANPITKEKVVVTKSGETVRTDVAGNSPLAPQQTLAIDKNKLPDSVVKIESSNAIGFKPDTFTVKAGEPVTVSLSNLDSGNSRTFVFTDASIGNVMISTPPSQTRAITFNAPKTPGSYTFIDGIPGHTGSGTMIVK